MRKLQSLTCIGALLCQLPSMVHAKKEIIPVPEILLEKKYEALRSDLFKNNKGTLLLKQTIGSAEAPLNWFNRSPAQGAEGVAAEDTYYKFGLPTNKEIIVAVIDSGVDVNHEDLQGSIWKNPKEIPNNNKDDDRNGYVDDVFGWNFIGGGAGQATFVNDRKMEYGIRLVKGNPAHQIEQDTLEVTRELARMLALKAKKEQRGRKLSKKQQVYLEQVKGEVQTALQSANTSLPRVSELLASWRKNVAILKAVGLREVSLEEVKVLQVSTSEQVLAKNSLIGQLQRGLSEARLVDAVNYYEGQIKYNYNVEFNPRPIVGDSYQNQFQKNYGNNDVIGPDSSHGTHVAGIIAANRNNSIGIKGVAQNVKIMAVRVVPDGDERDKDVANGIRYAVDNGAHVINMSFGKSYSPYKSVVDEAVHYAYSKGVLLVHAAGNSAQNNDVEKNFPNSKVGTTSQIFPNWLEVGASSFKKDENLPADFSNYGQKTVDVFAPGVDLLSTTPDNTYSTFSGTSMASPAVAGVAALILAYDDRFDGSSLRLHLLKNARKMGPLKVRQPGVEEDKDGLVPFASLSKTGAIADVFKAVQDL